MNLVDLESADVIAKTTAINPQTVYGLDIMSRISYAMQNPEGLKDLQNCLIKELNSMLAILLKKSSLPLKEFIVSANTCMCHILLGRDISSLGKYPFKTNFSASQILSAYELGLNLDKNCKLITLPHISAFIGSDIVSGIYAASLYEKSKENILFIDIGTNGEMILKKGSKLIATSCAVGPALEGMNISCGMRAEDTAIDDFLIENNCMQYTTLGNKEAQGICGSGVLALLRELLKNNILNKNGSISKDKELDFISFKDKKVKISISKACHILKDTCYKQNNLQKKENHLYFSARDIRQVQLAKAAITSAIFCLVKKAELNLVDINKVYIAGQFGKYISEDSFISLSILPKEFKNKIEYLGNTSLSGALLCLLDKAALPTMREFVNEVEYFELSKFENYERIFAKSLSFD